MLRLSLHTGECRRTNVNNKAGFGADGTRQPRIFLFRFVGCLSLQAGSSFVQFWPCLAEVALAHQRGQALRSATVWQRLPTLSVLLRRWCR